MGKRSFSDLLVIFRASRFLTVFPFDERWNFSRKYFLLSSGTALFLLSYTLYETATNLRINFSSISFVARRCLLGILPITHLYQLYTAKSKISRAFQIVEQCEVVLERLGVRLEYSWSVLLSVFVVRVLFSTTHNFLWAGQTWGLSLSTVGVALHVGGLLFLGQLMEMQFYSLLQVLRALFAAIPTAIHPSSKRRHLETLAKCHHLLSGVGDLLESLYSLQTLAFLSYIYVALLNFSLDSIKGFLRLLKSFKSKSGLAEESLSLALTVSWVIYCFLHFQFLAYNCVILSKEVKKTNKALYKTMLQSPNKCLLKSGKLRLQLEMNRQLNFTACGMFPLDYSMVHSVAASAAVFLVIISQFDT